MLNRFEEQYETQSERLARLVAKHRIGRPAVYDLAEIATCRQALAETARMLRRAAERDFGRCATCAADIPVERLSACPDAPYCPCCDTEVDEAVPA